MIKHSSLALCFSAALLQPALANDHFRQHDAHVHGEVEFNIAQDGHDLLIEITAPGADVVGFERSATTSKQKQTLEHAITRLNQPAKILNFAPEASCEIVHLSITHSLERDEHHDHDHDHDHDQHDDHREHQGQHAGDHHEKTETDEHAEQAEQAEHGGFNIEYHYQCQNIAKLNAIDTQWFSLFPTTHKIKVNLLTESKQAALELTPSNRQIKL